MLFHVLEAQSDKGVYWAQGLYEFDGVLDLDAMRRAWEMVVARHAVLRTGFVWEGVPEPLQVVMNGVQVPFEVHDWTAVTDQQAALDELLAHDRAQGFDLTKPPLMRVHVINDGTSHHRMVWALYSGLCDGWSVPVVLEEVGATYDALCRGTTPDLEPVRPYRDFIAWLGKRDRAEAEAFWRDYLAGFDAPTALPVDHSVREHWAQGRRRAELSEDLTTGIMDLARRRRVTPSTVIQAAWALLLSAYSGDDEVVYGLTVSGRPADLPGVESMVGVFINTLPVRVRVSWERSFADWLGELQANQVAVQRYEFTALSDIKRWSELPRGSGVFDSIVVFGNYPQALLSEEDEEGDDEDRFGALDSIEQVNYPIAFAVDLEDTLKIEAEFSTGAFDETTVDRLLDQLQALLTSAVARPDQLVREVTATPVTGWGVGPAADEFAGPAERFRQAVQTYGDRVAVRDGRSELTYAELGERVARVACGLRAAGVGVETRVGLWFERSVDLVVAILGVAQAGGTYVPLDPALPHGRLRDVQTAAGVELVVSRGDYALDGPRVVEFADLVTAPAEWPELAAVPGRLVYTMFTSGSTGVPKGVEVTEEGVVRVVLDPAVAARPGDVVAHMAAVSFDASTWEIWTALLSGATLAVAPANLAERLDVAKLFTRHGVTLSFMTTGLFHQLADTDPAVFSGHRLVLAGGEAMSPVQARKVLDANPSVAIYNMYGPTESTVYASFHDMHAGRLGPSSVPIGTALRGLRFYVLDRWLQPTPVGVPGELYIGGTGLARGYAGRPDLAAERFVADPYVPGARMYRTGDLVRWGADGAVDFVGRTDDQVKIRGFRVEPGEVEHVLAGHPDVANAAVVVNDKRLIAYVVSATQPAALKSFLAERLPEFLVPAAIVPMDELPLNPNGKLDVRALPDPGAPESTTAYEPPSTEAERTLAEVWTQVLGVERVGVHDNFFELGGDSIVSLQIVSRARAAGLRLEIADLFTHQTVHELAARVSTAEESTADQGTVSGPVAFTPIQSWFLREDLPQRDHFNWSGMFELEPGTDAGTMRAALDAVVAHHDALRLRLGEGSQENAAAETAELVTVLDAALLDGVELDEAVTAAMTTAQTSLSLVDGPLLRAVYVDRGGDRPAWFGLTVHHYVVDAVSWNVLLEDLETAYSGGALPPKTTSYQEWAAALEAFDPQDELAWWRDVVRTTTPVPADLDGPNTEDSTESVRVSLDAERTSVLLTQAHRAYRTQGHELLLAALLQVLGRWTGTGAAAIDLESHGREPIADGIDLSRTVGWFTAIHPVGLRHTDLGDVAGVIKAVKEQLRAVPRRGVGYTVLRERDAELRDAPARPVVFNYLGGVDAVEESDGLFAQELSEDLCGPAEGDGGLRSHVLGVEVVQAADGTLSVELQYSTNLHERSTISQLASDYVAALAGIVEHCRSGASGLTPSDVPLASLSQSSLDALVARTPGLADVYPLSPLQQGMLFHAVESPDSGVYWTQDVRELTGELDVEAMRAAWQLVLDRHPALRTGFVWTGEPLQVVVDDVEVPFEVRDWTSVDDPDAAVDALLAEDRARGCDLGVAPLLRVVVAQGRDRHWILLAFHHLYADGWSIPLLWDEVTAAYQGESLPPVRPYRDFIAWLNERDSVEAEGFWREYLAGFDSPTPLPVDRVVREHWSQDRRELALPRDVTTALMSLARDQRVTLSTVVQAAWSVLLAAYSGEDDVVFGLTVSGRPADLPGVESIVGLFINTLPVRVRVAWETSFADWLGSLQENQVAVQQHEHTPLADIQRVATGGLFDSMLVFGNYPQGAAPEEGEEDPEELFASTDSVEQMHYPIILAVDLEATLKVEANFSTGAFDASTVERLLGQLAEVLTAAARRPLAVVREMTPAPVVGWGAGPGVDEEFAGLAERFRRVVAEFGDQVAVRDGATELTYAELGERVARVASGLRAAGVRDETRVGLWFERSVDLVVAILAVAQAGGTYVPLDPALPHGRLRDVQTAAGVELVVSRGDYALEGPHVVELAELESSTAEWPELAAVPGRLVYTMFTSGSTGVPKGVEVTEEGVLRVVLDPAVAAKPGDVVAHMAAVSFDASTWEIWTALLTGATLTVAPANLAERLDVAKLYTEHGVTLSFMTTGLFHQLADTDPGVFSGHRKVLAGGEGMSPVQARKVLDANPAVGVFNMYGPTESTVYASFHDMHTGRLGPATVPIGEALRGLRLSVLDQWLRPAPVGVPGELYIGGVGLARGYAGRPDLAAERFVPDPDVPGGRMYRTGDLVRWGADGAVDFVGRTDDQVKIRGFRVEPGEVEHVLAGHPGVANAAVVVRELRQGKRLVAYVVGTAGPAELKGYLSERLPEFLVPSAVVALDELPLNSNGKLDKKALPLPEAPESTSVAPSTDVERTLAAVWSQVLGVERVGVHDNYFELGGDSIISLQVVARAREAGLELKIADLFTHQTIQQIAAHTGVAADAQVSAKPLADLEPLKARIAGAVDAYPLSPMQQGMLFHVLEAPADTAVYWAQDVRELRGPLDAAALEAAWRTVVGRHPALRSAFVWEGVEEPLQVVIGEVDVPFEVLDWTSVTDPAAALDDLLDADQRRGFDVTTAPLLRIYVADRGDRQWVVFTFHHLYLDGWSIPLVWDEVLAAYRKQPLPPVRPYRDYIAWLREQPAADDFWREYLDGFTSPTALPVDRTSRLHWDQGRHHRELPESVALALEGLARREHVTISAVVQAAWALLLASHSGDDDIVFGLTVSGRPAELPGVESIVGLFINTLPVRIRVPGDRTPFEQWLRTVQEGQVAAQRFEHSPLVDIQRIAGVPRLFESIVAVQNLPSGLDDEGDDDGNEFDSPAMLEQGRYPLKLVVDVDGQLALLCEYSTGAFDSATVEALLDQLERILTTVAEAPGTAVREIALLDADRRAEVLEWSSSEPRALPEAHLAALFGRQVVAHPERIALRGSVDLTYAELDRRASGVAQWLRANGVGTGTRVGLHLDRGPELIIAMLGVIGAGGSYVPLDPAQNSARLAQMVGTAGVGIVVTHEEWPLDIPRVRVLDVNVLEIPQNERSLPVAGGPDSELYVLFTSGSTGVPKGVSLTHEGVARVCTDPAVRVEPGDVVSHLAGIGFDTGAFEIWLALLNGATLVVGPADIAERMDVGKFLRDNGITASLLTTGLFHQLVETSPDVLDGLRLLVVGGDALQAQHARTARERRPDLRIVNAYGPTETTMTCTIHTLNGVTTHVPIGRPFAGMRAYVLDSWLQVLPAGVAGELFVGGPGVARGYVGRADLTAERFVPDPARAGERLYRTGDRARWRADGTLEFLGRADDQVKIRGFRVEPGEVEALLTTHDDVRAAAVVATASGTAKRLVAYVVTGTETGELRTFLRERLPDHLVPSAFVTLDALPLTANGKLDRRALPEPAAPEADGAYVAPRSEQERALAGIWEKLLGAERVGVHDNFFDLGGDSIASLQVVARARAAGLGLAVADLFTHQTVAELASVATAPAVIDQGPATGPVPLTPIQRWFTGATIDDRNHWNWSGLFELEPDVDADRLAAALTTLVTHHDALRTRLHHGPDGWHQHVVEPGEAARFTVVRGDVQEHMDALHRSLDLANGPLLAAVLFDRGDEPAWLGLVVHHLVVDGVSWNVLLEDLDAAYQGEQLQQKTTSFRRWAESVTAFAGSDEVRAELPYWLEKAETPFTLPVDATGANTEDSAAVVEVAVQAGNLPNAQVLDVVLAALHQTLGEWAGTDTVVVDLEHHGRESVAPGTDLSRTVGWFTSVHPLVLRHDDLTDGAGVVAAARESLKSVPRHGVGYGALRHLTADDQEVRRLRAAPERTININFTGGLDTVSDDEVRGLIVDELPGDLCGESTSGGVRPYALHLEIERTGEGELLVEWHHSTNLHRTETVRRVASRFREAAEALIALPNSN